MLVPNNLREQVWREDLLSHGIQVRDALKGLDNLYERLKFQNAPPSLVERFFDIRAELADTLDAIDELSPCFPERPQEW
jgi:hypothetical protein